MGSGKSSERPSRQTDHRNERKKTGRIKVIVVDDHPAIREALIHTISTKLDLELCGQAGSAEEAFDLAKSTDVDVAVIDISLQDAYGLDLVDSLRTQYPDLQVVVFSMYDESVYAERALRAGALGYVMKSEPTQAVIDAVRTVSEGEVYLSGRMASRILSKMTSSPSSGPAFAVDELTDREMAVFQMLGQGHSVMDIADKLHLSRKTVETYRRRAKEKLGFDSVAELLQYAIKWMYDYER